MEALVPRLGWVAFDPTNDLVGGDRHIRVAIGRDYADVPPTWGVYKGETHSELRVVTVSRSETPLPEELVPSVVIRSRAEVPGYPRLEQEQQQQQQ